MQSTAKHHLPTVHKCARSGPGRGQLQARTGGMRESNLLLIRLICRHSNTPIFTRGARRGRAVFNRFAHSAGPT